MPAADDLALDQAVTELQSGINIESNSRFLFERYHQSIVRFFLTRGFNVEDSRDCAQETLLFAFRSIKSLSSTQSFTSWIFIIAKNVFLDKLRAQTALKRSAHQISHEQLLEQSLVDQLSEFRPQPDQEQFLINKECLELMDHAINEKLSPQERRCLQLRVQGLKYHEIAMILGISIGTVKSHLYQAREKLKARLAEQGHDYR